MPIGGRETVLLVDDDITIVKAAARLLEAQKYVVLRATTPSEALAIAADRNLVIHLLLSDVMMPEMNGSELAARLTAERPELKLLFMSGYAADVIASVEGLEGAAFLEKPFTGSELAAKVRAALDR